MEDNSLLAYAYRVALLRQGVIDLPVFDQFISSLDLQIRQSDPFLLSAQTFRKPPLLFDNTGFMADVQYVPMSQGKIA
jgi:hypothetical protein